MPNIFITGGAGFIGSVLTSSFLDSGDDVAVYDNMLHGGDRSPPGARMFEGDVRDEARLASALRKVRPDVVVHLAALHYIPYCDAHPSEAIDVNVRGTRNLLDACRSVEPGQLFFASSAAVYMPSQEPHRETDQVVPIDIYGLTKAFGESLVSRFAAETAVACATGRLFNVFGPRDTNRHVVPEVVDQVVEQRQPEVRVKLGNTHTIRDYVYIDDAVGAIRSSLRAQERICTFNIGTGRGHSVSELVAAIGEAAGKRIDIVADESRRRDVDRPHLVADASALRRATGWSADVDLIEGLKHLLADNPALA